MTIETRRRKRASTFTKRSSMSISALRTLPAWTALEKHHQQIKGLHLRELFAKDAARGERFAVEAAGLYLDYSKNRITDETLPLLLQLAEQSGLRQRIDAMFRGDKINVSEKRRAACRAACAQGRHNPA
jgi:glucose-6-phosphate isomerase